MCCGPCHHYLHQQRVNSKRLPTLPLCVKSAPISLDGKPLNNLRFTHQKHLHLAHALMLHTILHSHIRSFLPLRALSCRFCGIDCLSLFLSTYYVELFCPLKLLCQVIFSPQTTVSRHALRFYTINISVNIAFRKLEPILPRMHFFFICLQACTRS